MGFRPKPQIGNELAKSIRFEQSRLMKTWSLKQTVLAVPQNLRVLQQGMAAALRVGALVISLATMQPAAGFCAALLRPSRLPMGPCLSHRAHSLQQSVGRPVLKASRPARHASVREPLRTPPTVLLRLTPWERRTRAPRQLRMRVMQALTSRDDVYVAGPGDAAAHQHGACGRRR